MIRAFAWPDCSLLHGRETYSHQFVEDLVQALELALFPALIVVVAATQDVNQVGGKRRGTGRAVGWSFRIGTSGALLGRALFRFPSQHEQGKYVHMCSPIDTVPTWSRRVGLLGVVLCFGDIREGYT